MIVEKAFLDKLKEFGLNSYESKLWTALLSRGVSTAGELADISGVPRSRSYDVLESLEKKGFIVLKSGKPIKYVAVPPSEVLDRVRVKLKEQTEEQMNLLESMQTGEIIDSLSDLHKQGLDLIEPTDLSGSLKGRENVYHHLMMMLKTAEKSINIMTSPDGAVRKLNELGKEFEVARKRGVKIRIIAPKTKQTSELAKNNETLRFGKMNNYGRFCIVDDKDILFMLHDDSKIHKNYDCAVWINAPYFAKTISSMFDTQWNEIK